VPSVGILLLRIGTGLTMAVAHGWPKLSRLVGDDPIRFADPFGLGATASLALTTFGELVCGLLLAVGLGTRLAAIPFAITMLVAIFHAHGGDPWSDKEHAFLFLVPAIAILITGPGRLSLDHLIMRRKG
jgi:putative oxidoreductase